MLGAQETSNVGAGGLGGDFSLVMGKQRRVSSGFLPLGVPPRLTAIPKRQPEAEAGQRCKEEGLLTSPASDWGQRSN